MVYKSGTVCFSNRFASTEINLSLLLITCSKIILKFYYLPKVILKLHLDGKLQVTLLYYLCYQRDSSYCQTLRLVKRETVEFENSWSMLWSNHCYSKYALE